MGLKKNPQTRTRPDPIVYIYIYILKYLYIYIYIYIYLYCYKPKNFYSSFHFSSQPDNPPLISSAYQYHSHSLTHKSQSHSLSISLLANYPTSLRCPGFHHQSNSHCHPNLSLPSQAFATTQALSVSLTHRWTWFILFSTSLQICFFVWYWCTRSILFYS